MRIGVKHLTKFTFIVC